MANEKKTTHHIPIARGLLGNEYEDVLEPPTREQQEEDRKNFRTSDPLYNIAVNVLKIRSYIRDSMPDWYKRFSGVLEIGGR